MQLITAGSLAIAQLTKMGTNHDRNIDRIRQILRLFSFSSVFIFESTCFIKKTALPSVQLFNLSLNKLKAF